MKKPGRHHRSGEDRAATNELAAGRSAYERRAWGEAYELLAQADASSPLGADDLEMFAWAAALTGRDAECLAAQERLYRLCIDAGRDLRAARSAFWQGMRFLTLGEMAQGGAWLARAEAIVGDRDCSERGQLLLPVAYGHLRAGQDDAAVAAADKAITIGARFNEPDIIALAQNIKGRAMVHRGEIADGLALLDRAMLSAAPGDVTPIVTGLVYCNVIDCCQSVYALERSREWTAALTAWCAEQPELVTFAGSCHVHRAELMQISGDWDDAVAEARRASQHLSQAIEPDAIAPARYQEAEVYRLRGAFDEAEAAYRDVARLGREPQPGFALLRLSQGRGDAAAAAIRRVVDAAVERLERAELLPASVEIMIGVGALEDAEAGCRELEAIAATLGSEILDAIGAHARGALVLARGDAASAIKPLRSSFEVWNHFGAPYLAARLRVLIGAACGQLGDAEGAALQFETARSVFAKLGARPDLTRLDTLAVAGKRAPAHNLSQRELQVLRLVAAGGTNKAIARELALSEKTVDRHVSNIFVKLDVPSRAAATAHAIKHGLI